MENIGEICEIRGELVIEWQIKDLVISTNESNTRFESPNFYFSGTSWELWLYPNGETENKSDGYLSIYLMRTSTGFPVTLNYSIGLKTVDEKTDSGMSFTSTFDKKDAGSGIRKVISRSDLIERKSELTPSDVLTVICTLKNSEPNDVAGSLFSRLKDVSDNLKEIYVKGKNSDFILRFQDKKICAHRLILETRSTVFAAMLREDTKKNKTGEMSLVDMDKSTMNLLLQHMYCGDMDSLTTENVLSLYEAAETFHIKDVKDICLDYIKRNLSVEWVCDIIKFAELHHQEEMGRWARDYFRENARKILETENWKTFSKEKHDVSVELLSSVIKDLIPE